MKNTETYLSFKKYDIFTQSWLTDSPTDHHILIVHGLGEHSSNYSHMADYLCAHGISSHSFDLIGHGQSSGQRGYVPSFQLFVDQLNFMYERVVTITETNKLGIFCHSMGGLILMKTLLDGAIKSDTPLIFSNPLVNINVEIPQWKLSMAQSLAQLLPRLTLGNEINDRDLTKDQAVLESYASDPLRHKKISSKLFIELQENTDLVRSQINAIANPSLFLLSPSDKVCDSDATQLLSKKFSNSKLELFPQSGHEIVNDLSKQKAFDDIIAFMKESI
jgi:alpha-beta hydrolase superfamily lysophospholipase